MSLLAWYPFMGDINNHGCATIAPAATTNTSTYEAGKLGQSLKLSSTNFKIPLNLDTTNGFTLAFWFYCDSTCSAWKDVITFGSTAKDRLEYNGTDSMIWYNQGSGKFTSGTYILRASNTDHTKFEHNKWYHITLACSPVKATIYVNGIALSTVSTNNYTIDYLAVGNRLDAQYYTGGIQDLRIYDECLAPGEVENLARGLILHYPMNGVDGYYIGRNLYKNSRLVTCYSNNSATDRYPISSTQMTDDGHTFYRIQRTSTTSYPTTLSLYNALTVSNITQSILNKTITLSYLVRCSHSVNLTTMAYLQGTIGGTTGQTYNLTGHNVSTPIGPEWKRISFTSTIPATVTEITVLRFSPYGATIPTGEIDNFYLDVCEWKIEYGNKATQWVPTPEEVASLISTKVYDTSGYNNHGTSSSHPTEGSDTINGFGSWKFDGGSNVVSISPSVITGLSEWSIACWVKINDWNTSYQTVWSASTTTYSWNGLAAILLRNGSTQTLTFSMSDGSSHIGGSALNTPTLNTGRWYHIVCAYKGGHGYLFVNGAISDYNWGKTPVLPAVTNFHIGRCHANSYYNAMSMSDFRIYGTALSANQVKELYKQPIRYYQNGNMSAAFFDEVAGSGPQLKDNVVVQIHEFDEENFSSKIQIYNDQLVAQSFNEEF